MALGRERGRSSGTAREAATSPAGASLGRLGLVLVAIVLIWTATIRIRLASTPLERDEGEYAYAGKLILEGEPPYKLAYNMKFPGTYYTYALFLAAFGDSNAGIRTGLLLVNAASLVFVFLIGRRLFGQAAAVVAAVAYAVLSIDRWIMGVFAHATHFVTLAALAGTWLLLVALERGHTSWFALAGLLFGIAVVMKQHAAAFLPMAALYAYWRSRTQDPALPARTVLARALALAAGALAPFALLVALFAVQGVLGPFWFWTFRYASAYVTTMPLANAFKSFRFGVSQVATATAALWVLAGIGLVLLWALRWPKPARVLLSAFFGAAFLAIVPGFYFRQHYFLVLLPALALLIGVAVVSIAHLLARWTSPRTGAVVAGVVFAAALAQYVLPEREYLLRMGTRQLAKERYGSNPFVEAEEIARYLREHTSANERIAVLGSEPEIYFHAGRRSASGYLYMYPLMEDQPFAATMQADMIRQVEEARPRYLVYANIQSSWLASKKSDLTVLRWAEKLVATCYEAVGIADIVGKNQTVYVWDAQVKGYAPKSKYLVYVFRRLGDGPCPLGPY